MNLKLSSKRYGDPFIHFDSDNSSHTFIIKLTGVHKKILEIGTSIGNVSKVLKERENSVTGIEIDSEAAVIANQYCDHMIIGDVETIDLDNELEPVSFDVIICGDVLEHLIKPADLLKKVKKYLKPEGFLVVSLPNFCHGDVILNILKGDFKYTSMGLLDETHLRFFGLKNIIALFSECGYQISDIHTTKLEMGNTELKIQVQEIHPDLLKFIQSLPNSTVYQYVFIAHPSGNVKNPACEEVHIDKLFAESLEESFQAIKIPLQKIISAKESQIEKISETVISLEDNLIIKEQLILEKSNHVQELEKTVSLKELQILEKSNHVQELEKTVSLKELQILEKSNHVQELKQHISSLEMSITWQLTTKFHKKIIERLLPRDTGRRNWYDLGIKGGRIIITEGLNSFLMKSREYRRKLREDKKIG
jgi:2-polyprenyl-3-methyl-5-hydroxy-6-metoxy-1,4-benzoquinol methylase